MPDIKLTQAYKAMKIDFLNKCVGRTFVESAIKRLERHMQKALPPAGRDKWIFSEDTHEDCSRYARVSCVCIINPESGEKAPCWLFFPGEYNGIPLPAALINTQMAQVVAELGWK